MADHPRRDLLVAAKSYTYVGKVHDIYDGDTCTLEPIDLGLWTQRIDTGIRWYGINAAELRGGTQATKRRGAYVRDYVENLILNQWVLIVTHLDRTGQDKTGRYGRLLAEFIAQRGGVWLNVNRHLVDQVGVPFNTYGNPFNGWTEPADVLELEAA